MEGSAKARMCVGISVKQEQGQSGAEASGGLRKRADRGITNRQEPE